MGERGGGRGRGRGEVIKISEFAASTAKEVEEALLLCDSATALGDRGTGEGGTREREGQGEGGGGCKFVVIDLRGNRGGLLEGAVGLKDCVCCERESARRRERARVRASAREKRKSAPARKRARA
jgi:C-terminal processing protease CtpA/Prc